MKTASWMIVRNADGKAIAETYSARIAERYNAAARYHRAVPAGEYLAAYNRAVKRAGGVEPDRIAELAERN